MQISIPYHNPQNFKTFSLPFLDEGIKFIGMSNDTSLDSPPLDGNIHSFYIFSTLVASLTWRSQQAGHWRTGLSPVSVLNNSSLLAWLISLHLVTAG